MKIHQCMTREFRIVDPIETVQEAATPASCPSARTID